MATEPLAGKRAAFDYAGDPGHLPALTAALRRVVDPELAVGILELGLVYGVAVEDDRARIRITMTSPACPVGEWIAEEVRENVEQALGLATEVEIVWEPPWSPARMSEAARRALDGG